MPSRKVTEVPKEDLREFLLDARNQAKNIMLCSVSGRTGAKVGPLVRQFVLDSKTDVEALVDKIAKLAQNDCRALGFAQKYAVLAFAPRTEDPCGRFILAMSPRF
jgi:hypothetical protein